ncbi:allergen Asp f 7 homolog [Arachis ipaensis]|uniref:allergen Asp f 7 homolog n=1 Tax=Arachis ipaensis TaxID=130454 RepID=UPI0007AF4EA6|nr:allergen Asp f 7 homolog [Arachis ipaensis]
MAIFSDGAGMGRKQEESVGAACTRVAAAPTLSLLLREDEAAPAMLLPSPAYSDLSSPTMPMRPEERRAVFTPCISAETPIPGGYGVPVTRRGDGAGPYSSPTSSLTLSNPSPPSPSPPKTQFKPSTSLLPPPSTHPPALSFWPPLHRRGPPKGLPAH